jgi:hypothetical protein
MKTVFCALILALATSAAKADSVSITLDSPHQIAAPGATLEFFGSILNTGNTAVYLNADDETLLGLSLTFDDLFFTNVPISLAPAGQAGSSSGDIELFDITVSSPLLDAPGTYSGSYTLVGGVDGNAQDNLGATGFSVTTTSTTSPVPEPSPVVLVLTASLLSAAAFLRGRGHGFRHKSKALSPTATA